MRTFVDLSYFQGWSPFILTLELHPLPWNSLDLSYFQDWSPFILTLELHPMRPNEDLCGPVLLPGLVSLHPYLGTPPNEDLPGLVSLHPTLDTLDTYYSILFIIL